MTSLNVVVSLITEDNDYQLEQAASAGSSQSDKQSAFDAQLQNVSQSADTLRQLGSRLSALRASSEAACLNRSVTRQANALLANVNDQLRALYSHSQVTDNSPNALPLSELLARLMKLKGLNSVIRRWSEK